MDGLSNACLVGLSALVPAATVFVDLLGSVSITVYVEKDATACRYCNTGKQYSGRWQYDAVSAHHCFMTVYSVLMACLTAAAFVANVLTGVIALLILSRKETNTSPIK